MKILFSVFIALLSILLMSNTSNETIVIKPCKSVQLSKVNKNIFGLDLGIPEGWKYNETIKGDSILVSFSTLEGDVSLTINRYPKVYNYDNVLNHFDTSMNSISNYLSEYQRLKVQISNNEYIARRIVGINDGGERGGSLLVLFFFKKDYYFHIIYDGGDNECLLGTVLRNVNFSN